MLTPATECLESSTDRTLSHACSPKNSPGQRPEACLILCLSCFKSISLIIVRSQGPRWAKLGGPDNPRIPVGEENRSKIVWWRSWSAPRGVFGRFSCRPSCAHVSGSLRGPFWEPFGPQKCSFFILFSGPVGPFFELFLPPIFTTRPH